MPDIPVKEIGELLDTVTGKIPAFLTNLMKTLYSGEAGKNMGQAVGNFYKELTQAGIPQDEAIRMAHDYMMTIKDLTKSFSEGANQESGNDNPEPPQP